MKRHKGKTGCWSKHKFESAKKKLAKIEELIKKFDEKHANLQSDKCVCAFVVFNCEDSRTYCLEDYASSGSSLSKLVQVLAVDLRFCASCSLILHPQHACPCSQHLCSSEAQSPSLSLRRLSHPTSSGRIWRRPLMLACCGAH